MKKVWNMVILLFTGILIIYFQINCYNTYIKEKEEKRKIHTLEQLRIQQMVQKQFWSDNYNINYQKGSWKEKKTLNKRIPFSNISDLKHENLSKTPFSSGEETVWEGDCILNIPDIDLNKIVYTGKNREQHLENYELITAAPDMLYHNGGNYVICGHASKLYGHSLNRLKEVKKGDKILIKTKNKTDNYIVNEVNYINMNQTSQYCNQTKEKTLTIISCAKNISAESYIVIHAKSK